MNSKVYLYDGTYDNFMQLVAKLLSLKIKPLKIVAVDKYVPSLFEDAINLDVDNYLKNKLIVKLSNKIKKEVFKVYLSENEDKELIIYYFILNSLKYGNEVFKMRNLRCVWELLSISKYVSGECHKFKGFTRFKELKGGILYAEINPTNNILFLLAEHFKNRLAKEYWIIKDINRGIYCIHDKKNYYFTSENNFKFLDVVITNDEQGIEKLWQMFFETVGIKERKNKRCQMNFMPKKYWQCITEMRDADEKSN